MENTKIFLEKDVLKNFESYLRERENARSSIEKYLRDIRTFFHFLRREKRENKAGNDGFQMKGIRENGVIRPIEENAQISQTSFCLEKEAAGILEIGKSRLLDYKGWLLERYAVSSVNSMLAALNQFLDFLGYGFLRVKRIKFQKNLFFKEGKELTKEEVRRLIQTARAEGKEQLALCMETIACTGVRVSELIYFTVENIRKRRIEIHNKGKYRRILLSSRICRKLLQYCRKKKITKGPVFVTRTGRPKDRSNLWKEMKALKDRAGIRGEKIFPHNFRHLFARIYYQATRDIAGLADLLGHSSLNVTRIYTSCTEKSHQEQLDRIRIF